MKATDDRQEKQYILENIDLMVRYFAQWTIGIKWHKKNPNATQRFRLSALQVELLAAPAYFHVKLFGKISRTIGPR